jgi:hypothetical protein
VSLSPGLPVSTTFLPLEADTFTVAIMHMADLTRLDRMTCLSHLPLTPDPYCLLCLRGDSTPFC